jgi:hypothetical protein
MTHDMNEVRVLLVTRPKGGAFLKLEYLNKSFVTVTVTVTVTATVTVTVTGDRDRDRQLHERIISVTVEMECVYGAHLQLGTSN